MSKNLAVFCACLFLLRYASAAVVTISPDNVFHIDGKAVFPIGFTLAPPPGAKTPSGGDAYAELLKNGAVFQRCGPRPGQWGPAAEAELDRVLDAAAKTGLLCTINIPDLHVIASEKTELELRRVVTKYKDHPGLAYWRGKDEPWLSKVPAAKLRKYYDIIHELDPNHPVWLGQAPRGTVEELKEYDPVYDIGLIDIFPIAYPPGKHGNLPNKNISVVGDYADWMRQVTGGKKPFWMTLQICFSGVTNPGRTLRFPTFPEERYMSYQSIIKGARGLIYFGGNIESSLNDRDRPLGWNWTFYERVLGPVLAEFRPGRPLHPALLVPDSKLPVHADGVEFTVREAAGQIFILAAKREGSTVQTRFTGLPEGIAAGDVLFEEPRKITVANGAFTDWFGPNEVHVYLFAKPK